MPVSRLSGEQFAAAMEHSPIGTALVALDGGWLWTNVALHSLLGYNSLELNRTSFQALTHPDDLELDLQHLKDLLEGSTSGYQIEKRYVRKDGSYVWCLLTVALVRDGNAEPDYFISKIQDISQRKSDDTERTALTERLALATRAGGVGVWDWDFSTNTLLWDERMFALYGADPATMIPSYEAFVSAVQPDHRERLRYEMAEAIAGRNTYDTQFPIKTQSGEVRLIRAIAEVVRDASGTATRMVGTNWKVTNADRLSAVQHEQKRFRAAIEAMQGVVWTNDASGRMVGEQAGWAALTGQGFAEYQGYGWASAVHPEDAQPTIAAWERAVAEKRTFVFEHRLKRHDGAWHTFAVRAVPLFDANNGSIIEWVGVSTDITEQRRAEAGQARFGVIANTDSLTGLRNRRALMAALSSESTQSNASALVIFDLDGFKPINDTFGHPIGDKLLVEVGARLTAALGNLGTAVRLGGDEFALLLQVATPEAAKDFAENTVRLLSASYGIDARVMSVSACAGVAWKEPGKTACNLMREADIALYTSKNSGRGRVEAFSPKMQDNLQRKAEIEQALRQPGLIDMIDLAYQPIFHLDTLELRAFEALARWEHSELGWISPAEFIPITEQISTIEALSELLLRRAATVALSWPASVRLSFNLSPIQLSCTGSGERILSIIREVGLPAQRLQVEVTETALMADFKVARDNLALLRQAGTRVVLDDFGAGFASISYLREINFDAIKLDGSLITSITEPGPALPLLRGVLALCEAMGRHCIAEHVETATQLELLRELGCRYGQGFGLASPMSAASATELARAQVIDMAAFRAAGANKAERRNARSTALTARKS